MKFKTLVLATVIGAIAVSGCGILNEKKQSTHVHTIDCTIANIKDAHPDFKLEEKVPVIQYSTYLQQPKWMVAESDDKDHEDYIVIVSGLGTKSLVYSVDFENMTAAPIIDTKFEPNSSVGYSALDYDFTNFLVYDLNKNSSKFALPIIGSYFNSGKERIVVSTNVILHDLDKGLPIVYMQQGNGDSTYPKDYTLFSFKVNNYGNTKPKKEFFVSCKDEYAPYNQFRTVSLSTLYGSLMEHLSNKYDRSAWYYLTHEQPIKELINEFDYEINYFVQPKDVEEINVLKYVKRDKNNLTFELVTINKEGKNSQILTVKNKDNQTFACNGITFKLNKADIGEKNGYYHGTNVSLISTKDYKYNSNIQSVDKMLLNGKDLLKYYGITL